MICLARVNNAGTFSQTLVYSPEDCAAFVGPEYRTNANVRVYLFELTGTSPVPKALAVWRGVDPDDANNIVFYVETTSGRSLFSFEFLEVEG